MQPSTTRTRAKLLIPKSRGAFVFRVADKSFFALGSLGTGRRYLGPGLCNSRTVAATPSTSRTCHRRPREWGPSQFAVLAIIVAAAANGRAQRELPARIGTNLEVLVVIMRGLE